MREDTGIRDGMVGIVGAGWEETEREADRVAERECEKDTEGKEGRKEGWKEGRKEGGKGREGKDGRTAGDAIEREGER